MKLAEVIEGGLTGASTLTLLQEAIHKIDHQSPRPLLHKSAALKKIQKKKGKAAPKHYIQLATDLLSTAAYFGLTALGSKKNAVLRGGLLGTAAGLGSIFLNEEFDNEENDDISHQDSAKKKILKVLLYSVGGLIAGMAIKKLKKDAKKFIKKF